MSVLLLLCLLFGFSSIFHLFAGDGMFMYGMLRTYEFMNDKCEYNDNNANIYVLYANKYVYWLYSSNALEDDNRTTNSNN